MNKKIQNVVKFMLYKNIKTKSFVILNVLLLIVAIFATNTQSILNVFSNIEKSFNDEKLTISLYDETNMVEDEINEYIKINNYEDKVVLEILDKKTEISDEDELDKNAVIIEVEENLENIKIISKEAIAIKYYNIIEDSLLNTRKIIFSEKYNIELSNIEYIQSDIEVERIMLSVDNEDADSKLILNNISSYGMFFILIIVLSKIANDISQEKMSKSIEYILTSISEKDYLISKIIGMNLLLLTQVAFGFIYYLIGTTIGNIISIGDTVNVDMSQAFTMFTNIAIEPTTIIYILATLILGILSIILLSVIQAAISSKTTNLVDAGNSTMALLVINVIIYTMATFLITPLKIPSLFIYILSVIPIVSSYFVPAMIVTDNYNIYQIIISVIINLVSIKIAFNVCAKIFKKGILDYGTSKSKKEEGDIKEQILEKLKKQEYSKIAFIFGMTIIIYLIVQNISLILFSLIISPIAIFTEEAKSILIQIFTFIFSLYIPALFVVMYTRNNKTKIKQNKDIKAKTVIKDILYSLTIIIIIQYILNYIFTKLGITSETIEQFGLYNVNTAFEKILFFIQLAILPAIFEELLFRKNLLNVAKKRGNNFAIISTAILFGLIHLNLSQFIFASIMGIIFSKIAIKYNSIKIPVILHLINNGFAALTVIFEDNILAVKSLENICIAITVVGVISMFIQCIKYLKKRKTNNKTIIKKEKRDFNKIKEIKYLFTDYTFIISLLVLSVTFILIEKII